MKLIPTIGRIVLYVLSAADAVAINDARQRMFAYPQQDSSTAPSGAFIRQGNVATEGDIYPADVVRVFNPESDNPPINLQVKLDGNDTFWATSRFEDDDKSPGSWHWMEYQKQQAAKEVPTDNGPLTGACDPSANFQPGNGDFGQFQAGQPGTGVSGDTFGTGIGTLGEGNGPTESSSSPEGADSGTSSDQGESTSSGDSSGPEQAGSDQSDEKKDSVEDYI
ncbi:hypothetical protein JIN84_17935 [Luteolibacter yonseiensis]|uniref:Uncharacterized protein n=1 Tax=Luteolibacter yonseiensis TaxID=1144680 RepID=A0A934VCZ8_9BACT|nr:hypothetical protein [Luteolibacter yonseiensis]MBK1817506.1 hypothetical protein [Luteolibacter yonseiensis]